jgi:cell division protease FtsH
VTNKRNKLLLVGLLALLGLGLWSWLDRPASQVQLPFSTFVSRLDHSPDAFERRDPLRILAHPGNMAEFEGRLPDGRRFATVGYLDQHLLEKLGRAGLAYEVVPKHEGGLWLQLGLTVIGLAIIVGVFWFILGQVGGGGMMMRFRNSRARLVPQDQRRVTFADVAGIDEAKTELEEIISFLQDRRKFTRLGGRIPRGVLLMGPPGTGKTLLARAIAGEAGVPFFLISGSDFVEMFVGVGASRVRALFEQGKASAPCIIFVDEIDAVGRQRGAGLGGGHDEREQTLNQLLVEMDGFEPNDGVILIAATNRPDVLDPALLRPGRFDRRMLVPQPDVRGRHGILKVHTLKTPLASDVNLDAIARGTPGFVGADLANLVNEAALGAARANKDRIEMHDFEMAKDRVLMGPERRSLVVSDGDRKAIAYYEAGHTVVGRLMKGSDPIHKVTIIPRGRSLGRTQQLPAEDRLNVSRDAAEDQIALGMGGRVAEEIFLGRVTTGAAHDIRAATALARRMVCEWGMSDRLGPLHFRRHEQMMFLGRDIGEPRSYSKQTASEIDAETRRIVNQNQDRAKRIVLDNLDKVKLVAEALLEHETLTAAEIDLLYAGEKIPRKPAPG